MKRWSFVAGAALIVLGVFALLQVGLDAVGIHFRIWWIFWPLVLIGIGVWIVTGISRGGFSGAALNESVPLEGATEAQVVVHHGAGRLIVDAGAPDDQLLSGSFGGGLEAIRRRDAARLSVDMRVREGTGPVTCSDRGTTGGRNARLGLHAQPGPCPSPFGWRPARARRGSRCWTFRCGSSG